MTGAARQWKRCPLTVRFAGLVLAAPLAAACGDATGERLLTRNNTDDQPIWSPDGTRIAFTRRGLLSYRAVLMVVDVQSGPTWEVGHSAGDWLEPAWSLDGSHIAYHKQEGGPEEEHLVNSDGTGDLRLAQIKGAGAPRWTSDGGHLYFTASWGTGWAIYLMEPDGSARNEYFPGFIPRAVAPRPM